MVKKVENFVAHDGRIFLSEEAAVRYEAVERLCEVIPEFAMVRPRLEASLDAVASAMGPMVAYQARVPSEGPSRTAISDCPLYAVCPRSECDEAGACQAVAEESDVVDLADRRAGRA